MNRKLLLLIVFTILNISMIGCNKNNIDTNISSKDKIDYEKLNAYIDENEETLLKENVSIGNGYVLVPTSIDLEDDEANLNLYAHFNNKEMVYDTTGFANYIITAHDNDASYIYSFYETQNGDIEPFIFLPALDSQESFGTPEFFENKIGENKILEFNYKFNQDGNLFYVKLLCLEVDDNTLLMCHRISQDEYNVDTSQAFIKLFNDVNIIKK